MSVEATPMELYLAGFWKQKPNFGMTSFTGRMKSALEYLVSVFGWCLLLSAISALSFAFLDRPRAHLISRLVLVAVVPESCVLGQNSSTGPSGLCSTLLEEKEELKN